ncbi:MAG: hypothetical protein LBD33_01450 [Puniceicoccales bacterium]|nr:hypothetical protein [Puniceicoccales bacterium]
MSSGPLFLGLSHVDGSELERRKAAVEEAHSKDFMSVSYRKVEAFWAEKAVQVRAKMRENNVEYTEVRAREVLLANYLAKRISSTRVVAYTSERRDGAIYVPAEVMRDSNINVDVSIEMAKYANALPVLGGSDAQLVSDGVVREVKSIRMRGLNEFFAETDRVYSVYNASNWNDPRILGNYDNLRRVAKLCASAYIAYKEAKGKVKGARQEFSRIFGSFANPNEGQGDELDIESIDWNI